MRKLDFSITMINWLILFKVIIALCSENYTEPLNIKCGVTDCQSMWYMYLPLRFTWLVFKYSARSCFLSLEFNGKNYSWLQGRRNLNHPCLTVPVVVEVKGLALLIPCAGHRTGGRERLWPRKMSRTLQLNMKQAGLTENPNDD